MNDKDTNDSSNESPVRYIIHQRVRICLGYSSLAAAVLGTENVDLNRKTEDLLKSLQHDVLSIIRG